MKENTFTNTIIVGDATQVLPQLIKNEKQYHVIIADPPYNIGFNEPDFTSRLRERLEHHLPQGDSRGSYGRSVDFTFTHYNDAESLKVIYIASKQELIKAQPHIRRGMFKHLEKLLQ